VIFDYLLFKNFNFLLALFFINFILYFSIIFFVKNKLPNFLGVCISNEKTSLKHKTISRGLGIFFIITLIPYILYYQNLFQINDLCLIISACVIGFWDDKRNLSQIFKLNVLLIIGFLYVFFLEDYSFNLSFDTLNLILLPFYFIFMVLFFNQIDGINGLAGITFIVIIFIFNYFLGNLMLTIPIIGGVFAYLVINIKGSIGIQGEAGSFFMGAVIFVLSLKVDFPFHGLMSFIFLLPILLDIASTTIIRYYLNINILEGHRSNIYQKLVAKYKKPGFISLLFGLSQLIIGFFIILTLENIDKNLAYTMLFILIFILTLVFLRVSFLIHSKKLLDY